jgi:hypothetical protein
MVDPLAQVARGAPLAAAYDVFMQGIKAVFHSWSAAFKDMPPDRIKSEWEQLAEHIGATEVAAFTHHVSEEYSSVYMSPAAKKVNDFMFKFNGMEAWDRANRISATKWAVRFIEKHAGLPDKNTAHAGSKSWGSRLAQSRWTLTDTSSPTRSSWLWSRASTSARRGARWT